MIATVTLNPAIDKTLNTSRVILGSVNRMDSVTNIAGGKGINVAKVLRQYGYEVKTLGFLGGFSGKIIKDALKHMGIIDVFTGVKDETRTSINVISEDGYVTELLEPGPEIKKSDINRFLKKYKEQIADCEIVVISGSTPQGVTPELYEEMINIANSLNIKVLLDTSGNNLKQGLKAKPYMVKPNTKELESLMGYKLKGIQGISDAAVSLVKQGIQNVMVSMGARGILLATENVNEIKVIHVPAPELKVVNSVGSGDCAVAAFALSIMENLKDEALVKKCVAVSAANVLSIENGDIEKTAVEKIEAELRSNVYQIKI